jgi:hypothetical protein
LTFLLVACGSGDDTGETTGGTDAGSDTSGEGEVAEEDTGGGGLCGEATPCRGNSSCTDEEYCSAGCCAPRTTVDPDTGGGGEACGDVTFQGECQGNTAVWCDEGTLGRVDCTGFVPEGNTGTCEFINDDFGFWCTTAENDPCYFTGDDGPVTFLCAGDDPACVLSTEGSACLTNIGTCSDDDEGCYDDTNILLGCGQEQPILYNCDSNGGTCDDGGDDPICVDIPEAEECIDGLLECADGLACEGQTDTEPGTCVEDAPDAGPDAGSADSGEISGDGGTDAGETPGDGEADAGGPDAGGRDGGSVGDG